MKKFGIGILGDSKIVKLLAEQIQHREDQDDPVHFVALAASSDKADMFNHLNMALEADEIIESDTVDIVVVCTEGVMNAYDQARKALEFGKHVVTNNMTMLAAHGEKLWRLAEDKNVHLRFEACAMGSVPVFENIFTHFKGQDIQRLYGTLNATCNFALMRMKDKGDKLTDALSDAIELGYAEKDPNLDISGKDSLFKMALLHTSAFGEWLNVGQKPSDSLEGLEPVDIQLCQKLAMNIKLLAQSNGHDISVAPTLFEEYTQMGNTTGTLTGLVIESTESGPIFFCGHAADYDSIASAMLSDSMKIAFGHKPWKITKQKPTASREKMGAYYIRVMEPDSDKILNANHLHVLESQNMEIQGQNYIAYIVETGMPKNELSNFLKHGHLSHSYYLMNVFKD